MLGIILIIIVLVIIALIAMYNGLVSSRAKVDNAWRVYAIGYRMGLN